MNTEFLAHITGWFNEANGLFTGKTFSLPLGQAFLVLALATACLVWGKFKWGFLLSYGFIFYSLMAANKLFFVTLYAGNPMALMIYVFAGLIFTLLIFYGFFQESH